MYKKGAKINGGLTPIEYEPEFKQASEDFGCEWGRVENAVWKWVEPHMTSELTKVDFASMLTPELREELKNFATQAESLEWRESNKSKLSDFYLRAARHLEQCQENIFEKWEFRCFVIHHMELHVDRETVDTKIWKPTVEEMNPSSAEEYQTSYKTFEADFSKAQLLQNPTRCTDWKNDGESLLRAWNCLIDMREEAIKEIMDDEARHSKGSALYKALHSDEKRVCRLLDKCGFDAVEIERLYRAKFYLAKRQELLLEIFIEAGKYLLEEHRGAAKQTIPK
jgi:hypothetical protein